MSKVIRAAELGFGTSSIVKGVVDGVPDILTYSSIVSQVDEGKAGLSAGMQTRDTVKINVKDKVYEVGPDAKLTVGKTSSRVLNSSYVDSDQYKALLFGALVLMNEQEIDLLVLGLPVDNWSKRDALKQLVEGTHFINGKEFKVKKAWVIVQPLGGLFCYVDSIGQEEYNKLADQTVLSVDPGYGTFDFIVSQGLALNESLSDGDELGMSVVLDAVTKKLRVAFAGSPEFPVERVDEAFWKNGNFIRIAGTEYPFPVCEGTNMKGEPVPVKYDVRSVIEDTTNNAVTKIKNKVGEGYDIDRIILMGGPAKVYLPALKRAFPSHQIEILDDNIRAICRGMYYGGVQYMRMTEAQTA